MRTNLFGLYLLFGTTFSINIKLPLPTADQFLEKLFNVTALEVIKVASAFDFDKILDGQINFLHYKSDGSYDTYEGNLTNSTPDIDASQPIKFIIHGWHSTGTNEWVINMAKEYHKIGVKNVIAVDWSTHAKKNYLHSAGGTKKIGEIVANFVVNLIKNETKYLENVHLVGHSLGAQVSGFAGKEVKKLTNGGSIARITGLDAAAPLFEFPIRSPDFLRLADKDAIFVDSIHTNSGFLGFLSAFGDADFYVEYGGPIQPACTKEKNIFESIFCSHGQAHAIFINTITTDKYNATSCDGPILAIAGLCLKNPKVPMGEPVPPHADGQYYMRVNKNNEPLVEKATEAEKSILGSLPGLKNFS